MKRPTYTRDSWTTDHFRVIKSADNYYGVWYELYGKLYKELTSAETLTAAMKKAKLLDKGFELGKEIYCEW